MFLIQKHQSCRCVFFFSSYQPIKPVEVRQWKLDEAQDRSNDFCYYYTHTKCCKFKQNQKIRKGVQSRVFHHFFKHFLAEPNRAYNFIAISVPQIQNFRKFGPKLRLLQAKNKLKQPNTADRPILAAPQPSRAELEHPQFWSDFSEILDLRS